VISNLDGNDSYFWPFPRRLRLLFDESRANQTEVAEYVGVSRQAVSQWLNGKTTPDCYNFKKVAEFFKVPLEYLYGDTDSKEREYLALFDSIGLSDKALAKLQAWASKKRQGLSFPLSEILSGIIADNDFDRFIGRIQLVIAEHIEYRFQSDDEGNQAFLNSERAMRISRRDLDNYARIVGMRAIETEDLTTFYRYQALQYLERVLADLPEEYYIAYKLELGEEQRGKHSTEEE